MHYKAVFFDMDGVLVDSEGGYNKADAELFSRLGIPFGRDEIAAVTGSSGAVIGRLVKSWHPHLSYSAEEICDLYTAGIFRSLKNDVTELVEGTMDWIAKLHNTGIGVGIGSSSSREMVLYVVERFGLAPLMDTVVTCNDAARGKPWPDIYLKCAENLGLNPMDCLVIEDSTNGILSATAAGMDCAAFTGTNRHKLDVSGAKYSFHAFDEKTYQMLFGA